MYEDGTVPNVVIFVSDAVNIGALVQNLERRTHMQTQTA
jgi:hypothetical protein